MTTLTLLSDFTAACPADRAVVIAGPTASGKSALALWLAERQGRTIVNADAMQVYGCWRVLTARPDARELRRAPHALYGHVAAETPYSVGDWLKEIAPLLAQRPRPVIVGGTGLYLTALTEGLADIPATEPDVRRRSEARLAEGGLGALIAELDAESRARIDRDNPRRVQRAWEVLTQTGRGIAAWQAGDTVPLLPPRDAVRVCLSAERTWLTPRIEARVDRMMADGAREEIAAMAPVWSPDLPAARAIGAPELMSAHLGETAESTALAAAKIATIRYAKRQRTWFRRRMRLWQPMDAAAIGTEMRHPASG